MPRTSNSDLSDETESTESSSSGSFLNFTCITVEPIIFCLFFASSLTDALTVKILLHKTCLITFNYTLEQCSDENVHLVENNLQVYVANLKLIKSIMESVIGIFISFFIGPWLDTHGKKLFLYLPLLGYAIYYLCWVFYSQVTTAPPVYYLAFSLIPILSGGITMSFAAVYSYITDITTEFNRGLRMTYLLTSFVLADLLGYLLSPLFLWYYSENNSYTAMVYLISSLSIFAVLKYVVACVPETVIFVDENERQRSFINQLISFDNIKQMVKVVFVRRKPYGRLIFFLICFVLIAELTVIIGESNFRYLIVRKVLNWSLDDYNFYSASLCASTIVSTLLVMWLFTKAFRIQEIWVALLVAVLGCFSSICLCLSKSKLDFYLAGNLGVVTTVMSPAMKVEVSRLFPPNDMGKVFSIVSIIEALTPFISLSLYTNVYDIVVNYKPQYLSFLSAISWILITLCIIIIITIQHWSRDELDNEALLNTNDVGINQDESNSVPGHSDNN